MKKHIAGALAALLLLWCAAAPALAAGTGGYSDVPAGHWAAESIARASALGLFQGVGDGRFGLGEPISRAAFATALARLFRWESVSPAEGSYTDVRASDWYYGAVETIRAHGAVDAAASAFRPTEALERGEMASMTVRALGYTSLAGLYSAEPSPFTDVAANRGFITVARDLGIMDGVGGGRFDPDGAATREQAAAILVRVYDRLYAVSEEADAGAGYRRLTVATPAARAGDELPATPLEPLPALYEALRALKASGTDMDDVALVLRSGGVRTVTCGGEIVRSDTLTAAEVENLLERGANAYYSQRYESAYCIYAPNESETAVVWYQSEESKNAKLQLARLFGVTKYVLEQGDAA